MLRKSIFPLFVLIGLLFVISGCQNNETGEPSQAKGVVAEPIQVRLTEFSIQPNMIRIKAGETAQIELINEGKNEHEFMVGRTVDTHAGEASGFKKDFFSGLKANSDKIKLIEEHGHGTMVKVPAGGRTTLTLTAPADRIGEWEVACFVAGHYESGMKGALMVEAATTSATSAKTNAPAAAGAPAKQGPASAPANPAPQVAYKPGAVPIAMVPAADRTSEMWMEYLGLRLVETRDSSGPAAFTPKSGDLYFVTNESTTWGATNTRNNIVFIDARTKQPIIQTDLPEEYAQNFASHSVAVSSDGKWLYLPAQGGSKAYLLVINGQTLKLHKVYESLGRPHHINNFTGPDGRELIMVVDFGWNWSGSGIYVLDPAKDNAIVGGMNRADFSGAPYIVSSDVDGKYAYATVPAPTSALREKMDGYLAKINLKTWKVEQAIPIGDPIWPEVSLDGKTAWVTLGGHNKVAKIDLDKGVVLDELSTGPGPWGARLSYDGAKLYIADKGEAYGYGQQGRTMSIIDTEVNIATNVVPIGLTTDHIILSPDGEELWATSNADHSIVIVDANTEEVKTIIKMPNNGDAHGSTFIHYHADGKGGVTGEVVSSFTGLRGSALKQQKDLLKNGKPQTVKVTAPRPSSGTAGAFIPDTLNLKPGTEARITFVNSSGTSGGVSVIESQALGIARFELKPGARKTVTVKTPTQEQSFKVINPNDTKGKGLTINVKQVAAVAPGQGAASTMREIKLIGQNISFDQKEIAVKAGESVRFVLENRDDEKHNLVGTTQGANLLSADVDRGQTGKYEWTAPTTAGSYKVRCAYHPAMTFNVVVQ